MKPRSSFRNIAGRTPQPADEAQADARGAAADDDRPRKIYVELTTRCNLQCEMCLRHDWDDSTDVDIAASTFDRLLAQAIELGTIDTVQLGGFGEPTIHPDCFALAERLKRAGMVVELLTNGTTLDAPAIRRIVALQLDRLIVSLDGVAAAGDNAMHDASLTQVQAALRGLQQWKVDRRSVWPRVDVALVVSRRNIDQLPQLKRLAPELGIHRVVVTNLVPRTRALAEEILYRRWTTARRQRGASPTNPQIDLPRLDAGSEAAAVVESLCASGTQVRVNGADLSGGGMRCRFVEQGWLAVAADGGVSPCLPLAHSHRYYFRDEPRQVHAHRFGNIRQTTLASIWDGDAYRSFRSRVRRFEFSPCIDCGGCDLRETNQQDCFQSGPPTCGECLWAAGLVQCP